jgi:hypothetical protein
MRGGAGILSLAAAVLTIRWITWAIDLLSPNPGSADEPWLLAGQAIVAGVGAVLLLVAAAGAAHYAHTGRSDKRDRTIPSLGLAVAAFGLWSALAIATSAA